MSTIITISRQYGSGGRLIGQLLANELGIPFYDKEIIDKVAEETGLAKTFITENEQKLSSLSSFSAAAPIFGSGIYSSLENFEAKIFAAEAGIIEKYAQQGSCVIVGRCADYILKGKAKCLNVFVMSDVEDRAKRVVEFYKLAADERKAQRLIAVKDKQRARHYRYFTDAEWGDPVNYHICVNSAAYGIEKCVQLLKCAYEVYNA